MECAEVDEIVIGRIAVFQSAAVAEVGIVDLVGPVAGILGEYVIPCRAD